MVRAIRLATPRSLDIVPIGGSPMAITWILVANASLAKLYANVGPNQGLRLVKELMHPASRQKNSDLVSDQSSANVAGKGIGEMQTLPKEHEAKVFGFAGALLGHVPEV